MLRAQPDDDDLMQCAMIVAQVAALTVDIIEDLVMVAALVPEGGVDEEYQSLIDRILTDSWGTEWSKLPECLRPFFGVRERLTVSEGLALYVFDGGFPSIVVPRGLQQKVVESLHIGHQSVKGMINRAKQSVYWPGIDASLGRVKQACEVCRNIHRPSRANL